METLSLEIVKNLVLECESISVKRQHEIVKMLDECKSVADISEDIFNELMDAFSNEAKKSADEIERIKKELEARKQEKADLEAQQLPYIKKAAEEAFAEMDKVAAEYEKDLGEIEKEVTKKIEGHKTTADQSEADAIRKKLGLGV